MVLSSRNRAKTKPHIQSESSQFTSSKQASEVYSYFSIKNNEYMKLNEILTKNQISLDCFIFDQSLLLRPADFLCGMQTSTGQVYFYEDYNEFRIEQFYRQFWTSITKSVLWDSALKIRVSESWRKSYTNHNMESISGDLIELGPISEYETVNESVFHSSGLESSEQSPGLP